ncbi:hypothetical protein CO038_01605 [Candidatus Pacearchaeota archaeon CG_4_9_14_0_2_um_filter_39_13]|nr:hypothetical protein [Candidatus Pacearchaeota archaeon]OIO42454.1 MAG: hypothetical protein AUJ64_04045 [Candidatus Pacearchaeota archaeon CG1_02_39_14]PJC44827.1 MAG: hypothetical protein CO038_01605 [Candidatus Pacearchaeota archaeon CG_4_9_14_0_2_um_filter_39_13]
MQEKEHIIYVLKEAIQAIRTDNASKLQQLSDQTIHSASVYQDTDSISVAVTIYSISKVVSRKDSLKIGRWNSFVDKISSALGLAIDALEKGRVESFSSHLEKSVKLMSSFSNLKPYIQDVLRKAAINKASKLYEHGISLAQTAKLLGITRWELSEYVGQKTVNNNPYKTTISGKKRAEMALEFFA